MEQDQSDQDAAIGSMGRTLKKSILEIYPDKNVYWSKPSQTLKVDWIDFARPLAPEVDRETHAIKFFTPALKKLKMDKEKILEVFNNYRNGNGKDLDDPELWCL